MTCKELLWAILRDRSAPWRCAAHLSYRIELGVKEILNRMQKDTVDEFFHVTIELRNEMPEDLLRAGIDVVLDSIVRQVLVQAGEENLLKSWLAAAELVK